MITHPCKHSRTVRVAAAGLLGFALSLPAPAGTKTIRVNLGTLAPRGSSYHRALQTMAQEWKTISDGRVRVVVYPDGTMGGEADMVRLMRVGTLHAALVSGNGLSDIEPTVAGLQSMPLRFRDMKEFDHVNEQLRPVIEPRIEAKDFVVLGWADAGWIRYFSKEAIIHPDDLRSQKVFAWEGDPEQIKIMRHFGLNPIALDTGDIQSGLRTGLIDVVAVPPIFALAGRIDEKAPHMLDLNWAPMVGALVVHGDTWRQIPSSVRDDLLAAAEGTCEHIRSASRQESKDAVTAMQKRGLQVHALTPELLARWESEAEANLLPRIRGTMVPAETYDQVQRIVKELRAKEAAARE